MKITLRMLKAVSYTHLQPSDNAIGTGQQQGQEGQVDQDGRVGAGAKQPDQRRRQNRIKRRLLLTDGREPAQPVKRRSRQHARRLDGTREVEGRVTAGETVVEP